MTFLTIGIVKIRKKHKLFNDNLNKQNIYIYAIPIFTILTLLIHENFEDFEKLNRSQILAFYISSILIFLTNILFFYLFDKLNENQQKFLEFRQREQHQNEYENYNKLVSQQDTAQKILIHDIKNHLRTMQSYQKEGNYELTNSYIASLLGEDSLSKNYSPSKSITFNLLLARYRTICEEAGIDFSLDVMGADIAAVADADITALICNLMDNAISAAEKSEPSFVELSIKQKAESPIQIFSIRNSSDAVPVFDMDGIPLTSKKDSALPHSIGTKSISLVADRYNGHVLYDYNEKTHIFKTVVLLDLEKDIKD
ncbi:MAG: GHKL domain-containing protein [Lachnospiraceae bacterium]|nr:GHKL domain-containing protein [Lachnospiraceae bacterium]